MKLLFYNCLTLNIEVDMIIGAEEEPIHQFLHGEETSTTRPTLFLSPPIHQEGSVEGAIIIEKEKW